MYGRWSPLYKLIPHDVFFILLVLWLGVWYERTERCLAGNCDIRARKDWLELWLDRVQAGLYHHRNQVSAFGRLRGVSGSNSGGCFPDSSSNVLIRICFHRIIGS